MHGPCQAQSPDQLGPPLQGSGTALEVETQCAQEIQSSDLQSYAFLSCFMSLTNGFRYLMIEYEWLWHNITLWYFIHLYNEPQCPRRGLVQLHNPFDQRRQGNSPLAAPTTSLQLRWRWQLCSGPAASDLTDRNDMFIHVYFKQIYITSIAVLKWMMNEHN